MLPRAMGHEDALNQWILRYLFHRLKKNHHCSNIWYYIFLLLDLEIIWSFQIFYFHFIMGLLDTCHDLMESFYKGLNLHWEKNCIISQVDTKDLLIVELGDAVTWVMYTFPATGK